MVSRSVPYRIEILAFASSCMSSMIHRRCGRRLRYPAARWKGLQTTRAVRHFVESFE